MQVTISVMTALCAPENHSLTCIDLCGGYGKEVETHCFEHIVDIDQVKVSYVVPRFSVFEAKMQHVRYCLTEEEDEGLL